MNGGVTFGASQSFPPGITPPGGGFDFQVPQSSSFTFGAPSTGGSNPFANLNGNASSDNGQDDISMQSPQKKPALGNTFGSSNTNNNMGSGFTFGQQAQPQSQTNGGFSFGSTQSASAKTNGTGLFGRVAAPEEAAQNSNAFGQSPQTQSGFSGFGQAGPAPQTQSSSFTFGQAPSVPKSQEPAFSFGQTASVPKSQEPAFSFGQNNNTAASPAPAFGFTPAQNTNEQNQTPSFGFGQSVPQIQTPAFSFGQPASTTQNQGGNNAFGSPNTSTPFSFGQSQSAPPASSAFGGFSTAPAQETQAASPLFGNNVGNVQKAADTANTDTGAVQNPFAGLFGQTNNASQITPTTTPAFNLGAPAQSAQPTPNTAGAISPFKKPADVSFGQTEISETSMNSNSLASHASSGMSSIEYSGTQSDSTPVAKPPSAIQQPLSSEGLFSPKASINQTTAPAGGLFGSPSTTSTPAKSLFSFGKPSQTAPSDTPPEKPDTQASTSTTPKAKAIFGGMSSSDAPPIQQSSTKNLFGGGPQNGQDTPKEQTQPPAGHFTTQHSVQPAPQTTRPGLFGPASTEQNEVATKDDVIDNAERVKRLVYTKAAPIIPGQLEAEQYREYDRNYRLHSLNVGLQSRLANLDPRSQDFDSVIRQYVASRESIGESLGLYVRNVAGMKRKGGQVEDRAPDSLQNKRLRSEDVAQPSATATATPFTAPQAKQPVFSFSSNNTDASPSKATSVLKGMIPASTSAFGSAPDTAGTSKASNPFGALASSSTTQASTGSKPANPFASLTSAASATPNASSSTAQNSGVSPHMATTVAAVESTTPIKSPPKKPTFEMPKFGGGNTNFMASFGTQAKESAAKLEKTLKEKRKAEDFDSEEDDEEEFNKQLEDENRAKRAKINSIAKAGFIPSFGAASKPTEGTKPAFKFGSAPAPSKETSQAAQPPSTTNRFAAFAKANDDRSESANDEEEDDRPNESGEDEDNDEEDGSSRESEEQEEDDLPEDEIHEGNGDATDGDYEEQEEHESSDDGDFQKAMARSRRRDNPNKGKSLFERIEANPNRVKDTAVNGVENEVNEEPTSPIFGSAKNSTFKPGVWGSHIGHSTPEKPLFSPFTPSSPQSASSYKPAATFNFTAPPAATLTPTPGASIFAGGFTKGGPVPGEGMFGSRPSTPSNVEPPAPTTNLSKSVLASPAGTDNTWKQGNGISFGPTSNAAPTFKFTASSPSGAKDPSSANTFGTLFGTNTSDSASSEPGKLGFNFGAPTPTASPAPGFLGAVSHLGGGSVASSVVSSRATSPGLTDNESVATNETEDATDDPQTSLMDSRSGEENEECLWEGRSKALMFVNKETAEGTRLKPNDWNSMGVGQVRVLQNKDTKKTRLVFRVEPSASILINSNLIESTAYESVPSSKSGAVRGALFYKGNLTRWVFKVKTPEMANAFAKSLEDNKKA